jgi:colicin import membrane protein
MQIGKFIKNKILTLPVFHEKNRKSFVISIIIHLTLIIILIYLSFSPSEEVKEIEIKQNNQRTQKIVQATMINASDIKLLQDIEKKKQADSLALIKAVAADKKKSDAAQKAAKKAKQRLKKAKKQYALNQKKLKLQRKKEIEKLKLQREKEIEKLKLQREKALEKAKQEEKQKKIEAKKEKERQQKILKEQSLQAMRDLTAKKLAEQKSISKRRQVLATTTDKYIALIQQTIRANWTDHGQLSDKYSVIVTISLSSSGKVLYVKVTKPSGNSFYDRQAVLAVKKSSPLPMPKEAELVKKFEHITLKLGGNN